MSNNPTQDLAKMIARGIKEQGEAWSITELAEYLIKNGTIRLPCKVGDTIFAVCSEYDEDTLKIEEHIILGGNYTHLFIHNNDQEKITTLRIEDIGNFLFFTKEEAEQKLKEEG